MKQARKTQRREADGLRPEYDFDYSRMEANRFAARMQRPVVAVVLDSDVAAVFDSAAKVNAQLRSAIAPRKGRKATKPARARHRKAS